MRAVWVWQRYAAQFGRTGELCGWALPSKERSIQSRKDIGLPSTPQYSDVCRLLSPSSWPLTNSLAKAWEARIATNEITGRIVGCVNLQLVIDTFPFQGQVARLWRVENLRVNQAPKCRNWMLFINIGVLQSPTRKLVENYWDISLLLK
jgi:hypothetical protein